MLLLLFRGVVVHGHKPKLLSRFPGNTAALNLTVTKLGTFSPVELHKYMTSQPGAQRLGVGYGPSLRSTRGPQRQKAEPIQVHCQSTLQTAIPNTGKLECRLLLKEACLCNTADLGSREWGYKIDTNWHPTNSWLSLTIFNCIMATLSTDRP